MVCCSVFALNSLFLHLRQELWLCSFGPFVLSWLVPHKSHSILQWQWRVELDLAIWLGLRSAHGSSDKLNVKLLLPPRPTLEHLWSTKATLKHVFYSPTIKLECNCRCSVISAYRVTMEILTCNPVWCDNCELLCWSYKGSPSEHRQ